MTNIFKRIKELDVTHAVVVNTMDFNDSNKEVKDYFIVAKRKDKRTLQGLGFRFRTVKPTGVIERTLTPCEVTFFKTILHKYDKVEDTEDGRVYELRGDSFKEYYKEW